MSLIIIKPSLLITFLLLTAAAGIYKTSYELLFREKKRERESNTNRVSERERERAIRIE